MSDPLSNPATSSVWHGRWRRLFSGGAWRLLALCAVGGALVGGAAWLGGSEAGLRWLGATIVEASGGRLQIAGISGRLLGDWRARSLRWRDGGQTLTIEALALSWSPGALARGQLAVSRLDAATVSWSRAASDEPAALPESLRLPFAVRIDELRIGRLLLGGDDASAASETTEATGQLLATAIVARLTSDGRLHRVEALQAKIGRSMLSSEMTLAGDAPFALSGRAQLQAGEGDRRYVLQLAADGTLARVHLNGSANASQAADDGYAGAPAPAAEQHARAAGGVSAAAGEIEATLTPFASSPVDALRLRLSAIDPALFAAGAPRALIDLDLELAHVPDAAAPGALGGELRLHNRAPGSVDRQRLPLLSLTSVLDWRADTLRFNALELLVAGGGVLRGQAHASVAAATLDLDLMAQRIDARALHASLPATRLAGPLHARLGSERQSVDVAWRDPSYVVQAIANADAQAIEVSRLQLAAGGASVSVQGRLALAGERRFAAHGRLRDVDVARFAALAGIEGATSQIDGDFTANGSLQALPEFELALSFALGGRLGGQPLAGKGEIEWAAGHLRRSEVELRAAGNRLHVSGGLGGVGGSGAAGRRGASLQLTLDAPRLAALGWPGLAGDVAASAEVASGAALSLATLDLSARVKAAHLRIGELFDGAGLDFDARLGAGASGVLALSAQCSACRLAAVGAAPLAFDVGAEGDRQQQRWRARLTLPRQRQLRLAASGGFAGLSGESGKAGVAVPVWRGTLDELRLDGASTPLSAAAAGTPLLELAAPVAVSVGADQLDLAAARLAGRLGSVSIDRLAYAQGRWQSAGHWQRLRPRDLLAEFSELSDPAALGGWRDSLSSSAVPPLTLAGEWEVKALGGGQAAAAAAPASGSRGANPVLPAAAASARVALWRESGDLAFGALPLGLETARVQATYAEQRLAIAAVVRGARAGAISAEFSLGGTAPGERRPLIDRATPWQGRLQADIADLSWLGPLLGEGWQVAGQLRGEMLLTGSAAQPQFSGRWRGERLALRVLDLGLRLERGDAELEITPQRLLLRRLRFESDFSPLPPALRAADRVDLARLVATPGVVEASGEMAIAGPIEVGVGAARLKLRLDRLGVLQRAEQWVAVSGDAELAIDERLLAVSGALRADAAFWALAAVDRPALSDDVVLRGAPGAGRSERLARAVKLDLALDLGRRAYFRGAGVDSRLAGELRLRSDDAGLPRATGSIRTVDGRFDAYGQKLEIERGIVNFQGPIDNPGLNLLAVRKNQQVEAGVEVSGTAQRPKITLVSTPNVPDAEKLSWLVLGRSPDQQGGDSALLFAAAQTLVGGQDGGTLRQLQRALGIDEFGVASGQLGGQSSAPTSRVASAGGFSSNGQTVNGQIVSVGKRLAANAVLSYQQSLNTTESIVKLTVRLNRQFSVVGSAGSDSAIDFFWTHSFGR